MGNWNHSPFASDVHARTYVPRAGAHLGVRGCAARGTSTCTLPGTVLHVCRERGAHLAGFKSGVRGTSMAFRSHVG